METVRVACQAMATRFEILLAGDDLVLLRAAGEEALEDIARLEGQLSRFLPSSEISRVNRHAATAPVPVSSRVFRLLEQARRLWQQTAGAFDPTVGPLMDCWGFTADRGRAPATEEVSAARERVGMDLVELEATNHTVRFLRSGVQLDLGAIGKGFALDCAVELLREAGVERAFLHGGTSSVYALGAASEGVPWKTAVLDPRRGGGGVSLGEAPRCVATVSLRDQGLGGSSGWGRRLAAGERVYGHVLDPRMGEPVADTWLAAVALPSATESDALATALLVDGCAGMERLAQGRPEARMLIGGCADGAGSFRLRSYGFELAVA